MQQAGNKADLDFVKSTFKQEKIRQIQSPQTNQLLGAILQQASSLAGIKEPIQDVIKNDLKELIYNRFGFLSLEEIHVAFKLERQLAYAEKTEHYQFFSTQYVAEILQKYTLWRASKKREHHIEPPVLNAKPLPTPQEEKALNEKAFWEEIERQITHYQEYNSSYGAVSWLWKGLVKRGLAPSIPAHQKVEMQAQLVKRLSNRKEEKAIRQMIKNIQQETAEVVTLKQEIAFTYFLKQITENQAYREDFFSKKIV